MVRSVGGVRYLFIPHMDITEVVEPRSLIIAKNGASSGSQSDDESYPNKGRKSLLANRLELIKHHDDCDTIYDEIKREFPSEELDVFQFKDDIRKLNDRLESLQRNSVRMNVEYLRSRLPEMATEDLIALCRLRTETIINGALSKPIRTPTITDVIFSAAKCNVNHVLQTKAAAPKRNKRRLDIDVDETSNAWSEKNLYSLFLACLPLESYRLAAGAKAYRHGEMTLPTDSQRVPLIQGPQNQSFSHLYHRYIARRYVEENSGCSLSLISEDEIILTFTIYHGVRGHRLAEFDVLSCQTLADLRDAFSCSAEIHPIDHDLELNGSCFMLNGQLFPDFRNGACDYAEPLLHFYETYKPDVLRTRECIEQSEAIVGQLDLKVYSAGFIVHHGDCEHRVMVTSVRRYDMAHDCPYLDCYPVCVFRPRRRDLPCDVCERSAPTKAVFNTPFLPYTPTHLCDKCYENYEDGMSYSGIYKANGLFDSLVLKIN